jgi:hypothetical protein
MIWWATMWHPLMWTGGAPSYIVICAVMVAARPEVIHSSEALVSALKVPDKLWTPRTWMFTGCCECCRAINAFSDELGPAFK